ncbi:MAG: ribose-phosphate pyrophosphokinase [Chloroflexi bacterium]|jgi:ribose-phosphate pyrophosphokinase|nr:MAG: ribose-phosphate pyrophosphokinase [Chloroflexota bacterium]
MANFEELRVFSGNAHQTLARSICEYLGISVGEADVFKFANDNTFVQFKENVRQRDIFLVQPFSYPVNENIMELLIMIDAAKRASAGRITAVIPYFAYGRTDKKDQPRVPITARLIADLISTAGADRVLTIDLHAGQIQGFFDVPVDELTALPILARYIKDKALVDPVVVGVDLGAIKRARDLAQRLGVPLAIIEKRRVGNEDRTETLNVIGDVEGKIAIALDDEIDTGGSLLSTIETLERQGVTEVYACCTHGVLSGSAKEKLAHSTLKELIITDTLPLNNGAKSARITVLSVAPLLGEAIHRIHGGMSVGSMFQ